MGRVIGIKVFRIFLCLIGVGIAGAVCYHSRLGYR